MKKIIKNIFVTAITLGTIGGYINLQQNETMPTSSQEPNYHTVIFKDRNDRLIPVEVDLKCGKDSEEVVRASIGVMQSTVFKERGLNPVLKDDLIVESVDIQENTLTLGFNESFQASSLQEGLDLAEMFSYVFLNDTIQQVKIKIAEKEVSTIPGSDIHVSSISKRLGINNFATQTNDLYQTVPVVVYNYEEVLGTKFIIPETLRVKCRDDDYTTQVAMLLDNIENSKKIALANEVIVEEGVMTIHLNSNILMDNELIDQTLYDQIKKSICSLDGIVDVQIVVDGIIQEMPQGVSSTIENRIKF